MKTGFSRTQTQAFVSFMLTPLVALKLMPPESRTTPDAPKASGFTKCPMLAVALNEQLC